jgi:hypothetical protein
MGFALISRIGKLVRGLRPHPCGGLFVYKMKELKEILIKYLLPLGITLYILHIFFYVWHGFMFYVMSILYWGISSVFTIFLVVFIEGVVDEHYRKKYQIDKWKK